MVMGVVALHLPINGLVTHLFGSRFMGKGIRCMMSQPFYSNGVLEMRL